MQFSFTISSDSVSTVAEILRDLPRRPSNFSAQISGLHFLQTYMWPIGKYLLQQASLLWFQNNHDSPGYTHEGCQWLSENYPGLVSDATLQFPGLLAHVTWFLSIFLWRYLKTNVQASTVSTAEDLWCSVQQLGSEINSTSRIFKCLHVSFSCSFVVYP